MEHNERIDSGAGEPVLACKRRKHLRLAALAVCCALLGGIAGGAATGLLLQGRERAAMRPAGQQTAVSGGESTGAEPSAARVASTAGELTPTQLYERYAPCVVGVLNLSAVTDLYGKDTMQASTGSGVLLTGDGEILTNYHVVKDCTQLTVTLYDGTEHTAKLLGYEEDSDIALLKIDGSGYRHARLGDSDRLRIGTEVAAIGNPLGELTFSLTSGAVSALNREVTLSSNVTMDLIQTDCAINSGNSGGALFNLYGEVIGITNAKYSSSGSSSEASIDNIGFAIPINSVRSIVESIIKNGYIVKPYIGVSVEDVSSEMTSYGLPAGAVVRSVTDGAPAAQAGLQANDIITAVDGTEITGSNDLVQIVTAKKAGDTLKLSVYRQGQTLELTVTVAEQKQSAQASSSDTQQSQQQDQSQQQQQGGGYSFPWGFGFGG